MIQLDEKTYEKLLQATRETAQLADQVLLLKAEVAWYREQIRLSVLRHFGPSSEKTPLGQEIFLFFNEAEALADPQALEPDGGALPTAPARKRKQSGQREMQIGSLPIEEISYELPEGERICPACAGPLHEIGQDVAQEVKVIPAQFILVRSVCCKYGCRHCNRNEIKTPILAAAKPTSAFPNSLASPSFVSYIMNRKFVEGTPLYRQEASLLRSGFELSRQTMANWMLTGAAWLEKIYTRMHAHLLSGNVAHADETTLQVLNEEGRRPQQTSYMWLYRSGRDGPPIVLYDYQTTRASEHPRRFLNGFRGYLHVDGYGGYNGLPGVTLVGCFAHARRYFVEALNLIPKNARKNEGLVAARGIDFCDRLFEIERDLHDVTPEERLAARQERSAPLLAKFAAWLEEQAPKVLPKSKLGAAFTYCRLQWTKLTAFLQDGRLEISNNRGERAIKPFVIGRKNWLFSNTPRGARSSAVIYSIVETAKENGLNPETYLSYLFTQLPNMNSKDPQALDMLLPWADSPQATCRIPSNTNA